MTTTRNSPYVWVTWITKHLSGENSCQWAPWFQAHHQYDKVARDSDLVQWTKDHDIMVQQQAAALRADGYTVYEEAHNSFQLRGNHGGTLSGKPDLVAKRDGHTIVIDCKTGQRRASDEKQVLVYMRLLPISNPNYQGMKITGRVQYKEGAPVELGLDKLDGEFETSLRDIMGLATGTVAPARTPTFQECRYCNISKNDCSDRVEPISEEHDLF